MFKTDNNAVSIQQQAEGTTKNYVIQINDYLKIEVYSNKGERIIDPNGELTKENSSVQNQTARVSPSYLVAVDGTVKFPMIEPVQVAGLTIREAENKLQAEYNRYYKECYVVLSFNNKRVIVLGAPGGTVIPLANDNMSVVEVLALAKGIGNEGKANNIRLIRGEDVYLIDFSTIEGYRKGNMTVQPGDIVYVEPTRRPFAEGLRDFAPVMGLVISLTSLLVVVFLN
jgi:polysaccharide biosynthesis/export protein